jgi:hypothetical protein
VPNERISPRVTRTWRGCAAACSVAPDGAVSMGLLTSSFLRFHFDLQDHGIANRCRVWGVRAAIEGNPIVRRPHALARNRAGNFG